MISLLYWFKMVSWNWSRTESHDLIIKIKILCFNFIDNLIKGKANKSVTYKKELTSSLMKWKIFSVKEWGILSKITMIFLLLFKKISLLFIKTFGALTAQININSKYCLVLNTQMEPNYHLIYGSFKGFVDNSILKFVFCWMLVPNQVRKEFYDICNPFKTKILVESLGLWVLMLIFSLNKVKNNKKKDFLRTVFSQYKKPSSSSISYLILLIRDSKVC